MRRSVLSHRLIFLSLDSHGHQAWNLILELNGEWEGKQRVAGITDPNSGGRRLYLSPGVRFASAGGWAAYVSLGIALTQNPNGVQTDARARLIAGFGTAF